MPRTALLTPHSATAPYHQVHGCLLHAATGQLVPEALRGHVRGIKNVDEEQLLTFNEVTVLTKPPSLAKRRGVADASSANRYRLLVPSTRAPERAPLSAVPSTRAPERAPLSASLIASLILIACRYRLLFSIWNTSTLSYISWQHMATPLVVRNSFHMLPIEEKNYRRTHYASSRARGRGGDGDEDGIGRSRGSVGGGGGGAGAQYGARGLPTLSEDGDAHDGAPPEDEDGDTLNGASASHIVHIHTSSQSGVPSDWLPLSQAPGYVNPRSAARTTSKNSAASNDDESQENSSTGVRE
jgi:hypothetical protein